MKSAVPERWEILPALTLFRGVLFPGARCQAVLATIEAHGAVREAMLSWGDKSIAVFGTRARRHDPSGSGDPFDVGTVAEVLALKRQPCCRRWVVDLRASGRLRVREHLQRSPFRIARVERILEPPEDLDLLRYLTATIRACVRRTAALMPRCAHAGRAASRIAEITNPTEMLALAMDVLKDLPLEEQQHALELPLASARLDFALAKLNERLARIDPPERCLLH